MNYAQPHRQYKGNVLTDPPYTNQLPPDAITQMYYDRKTDGWKSVIPSTVVYPKARTLIKEYQREYKEKWADIATVELDN